MKIRVDEAIQAREGIRSIIAFEHHKTRNGVRSTPMMKLMKLDRVLRGIQEDLSESIKELIKKYGEEKIEGKPETSFIDKDAPERFLYLEERDALMKAEVEIDDSLLIKPDDLKIRGEDGELMDMENGKIALLGPLYFVGM